MAFAQLRPYILLVALVLLLARAFAEYKAYQSNVRAFSRELDFSRNYVKYNCEDAVEVARWGRGEDCARHRIVVQDSDPTERALIALATRYSLCADTADCIGRFGQAGQGILLLLNRFLTLVVIGAVVGLIIVWQMRARSNSLYVQRMALPTASRALHPHAGQLACAEVKLD